MFKKKRILLIILFVGITCFVFPSSSQNIKTFVRIPVRFFPFINIPHIKIEIEDRNYSLLVDLGSSSHFDLKRKCVEKINKRELIGNCTIHDIRGREHISSGFRVPKTKIDNLNIYDAIVNEDSRDFLLKSGLIWPCYGSFEKAKQRLNLHYTDGKIGWHIFRKFDCFFDFPRSALFLGHDMSALIDDAGCSIDGFVEVPFTIENYGIVLTFQTDLGSKRFLLDTGATNSVLRESQVDKTKAKNPEPGRWFYTGRLMVENQDFGAWPFVLFEFCDLFACDGVLGVDFFNEHAIALDFHNQIAYIQPPGAGPGKWERFVCWFKSAFCV